MSIAVYPGSFDPVTYGHIDIIERSAKVFDKLIIAVLVNSAKKPMFTTQEKVDMIRKVTSHLDNVEVMSFSGLLVDFAKQQGASVSVRGLRAVTDFEYEIQIAQTNARLDKDLDTMFFTTSIEYSYVSSTIVKEIASYHGDVSEMVPPYVQECLEKKYLHEMIDDIEVLIDEAKPARFSPGKIMIEKDVLMTVIEELRKQIPGEIERSHKIILNKDAILEDARVKSQQMIDQAARDAGELIDQNEVVEMAKMRANEIETHAKDTARSVVHNANEEADQIRAGALRYVNEIMEDVQGYVASVKEAQESVFNQLLSALDSDLASIKTNAKEIEEQLSGVSIPQARTRTVEDFISDED